MLVVMPIGNVRAQAIACDGAPVVLEAVCPVALVPMPTPMIYVVRMRRRVQMGGCT